ncbi:MFS family permease [Kineosphaera limosa]|nr:MFS transporter [Kineosphaera limosa]NYE00775.1 MFS family permease [Kineosphaera limosa]
MSLFRNANYRAWFVGDTTAVAAVSLRQFAVPLLAFGLTGSTALAGVLVTVQAVVIAAALLPGGVLVDRHDRRTTIRVHAIGGLTTWGGVGLLQVTGHLPVPVFVGLLACGALLTGLFSGATDAALRSIVSTTDYPRAMATNEGRDAAISLTTGPVGGFLYAVAAWVPFVGVALSHALTWLSTFAIRTDLRPPRRERRRAHRELGDALRWAADRRRIRWLFPLFALVNFAVNGILMGLQFSLLEQGYDARAIGWLTAVLAGATLLGAVAANPIIARVPTGLLAVTALVVVSLALIPAALINSYPVILASLGVGFFLIPALNSSMLGYTFALTPVELQGRVQAILQFATSGLASLAPALVGWLLHQWGHAPAIGLFAGLLVLAAMLGVAAEPLRSIPRPPEWKDAPL